MNINDLQEAIFAKLTLGKLENHITTFRHTHAAPYVQCCHTGYVT